MDKQVKLIEVLLQKTIDDQIEWQQTPVSGTYQVSFTNSGVQIERDGRSDVIVSLINSAGEVADTFSDRTLNPPDGGGEIYAAMFDLYNRARRKALGAKEVLNDILNELEGSKTRKV